MMFKVPLKIRFAHFMDHMNDTLPMCSGVYHEDCISITGIEERVEWLEFRRIDKDHTAFSAARVICRRHSDFGHEFSTKINSRFSIEKKPIHRHRDPAKPFSKEEVLDLIDIFEKCAAVRVQAGKGYSPVIPHPFPDFVLKARQEETGADDEPFVYQSPSFR